MNFSQIDTTQLRGMADSTAGMVVSFVIPGKRSVSKKRALDSINQSAVCAACRGGCSSHQAEGVPVGMNVHYFPIRE